MNDENKPSGNLPHIDDGLVFTDKESVYKWRYNPKTKVFSQENYAKAPAREFKWWHRYDADGNKETRRAAQNSKPVGEGWMIGVGTHTPEHIKKISDAQVGVKKCQETKDKMSVAKLGIKKSDEHKLSMSRAHKLRWKKIHLIKTFDPSITLKQAQEIIKALADYSIDDYTAELINKHKD
jgi:hypothetical protein